MIRAGLGLAVAIASWACASPAWAEETSASVVLNWRSEEGCLNTEAFRLAVAKATSRNQVVVAGGNASIDGQAELAPEGAWLVTLTVKGRAGGELGRRVLSVATPGCAALIDHVVIVTAMLVDSALVSTAPAPPLAPAPPIADRPMADRQNPLTHPLRRKPKRRRLGPLSIAVGPVTEFGRLPTQSFGLSLSVALILPTNWRISMHGLAFPEVAAESVDGKGTLSWQTLGLLGCPPSWQAAGLVVGVCAGLEVGIMSAKGEGFQLNRVQHEVLLDVEGELWARWDLSKRLFLRSNVVMRGALVRPTFGYTSSSGSFETLYTPSAVGLSTEIVLGVTFL